MQRKENFSIVPTELTPFNHVSVAPIFAESRHIKPPYYDIYENRVRNEKKLYTDKDQDPRHFPFSQYLTETNLLPGDESRVKLFCDGRTRAMNYYNSSWIRNDIEFREEMSRILKKKLQKRFRHECNDTFSPYQSF
uniref:Uncharacterized protein n=1 Tax=viral metagenome TaxID=1070528 RepID=A0A6C0JQ32_9ZZZZ